jgi:hypothetical protein
MTNSQLHDLARRLRSRAVLSLDADTDAAHDLLMASYCLDDLRMTRQAIAACFEYGGGRNRKFIYVVIIGLAVIVFVGALI